MPKFAAFHAQRIIVFLLLALLLTGCLRSGRVTNVPLNVTDFLPSEWQALGALRNIDIDADDNTEYLLLYTYDQANGSGPVGALILDPQTEAIVTEQGELARDRPSGFPNPYAVLPNYWRGTGQGFIAAPGQANDVEVYEVTYRADGIVDQLAKPDTLILRGGNNYLTFVWWQNGIEGYGISQLFSPGGFEGVDWNTWKANPGPLSSVTGSTPLNNRSLFCRRTRYDLAESTAINPAHYRPPIQYLETDLGLSFCNGAPLHAFYAEGVVLTYLTDADKRTAMLLSSVDETVAPPEAVINFDTPILVDEIKSYREISLSLGALPTRDPVRTSVCADLRLGADASERQLFLFMLEHRPPQLTPATPDRLYIRTITPLAAPGSQVQLTCDDYIIEPPQS